MSEESKGFWSSLPGFLTAVAGVITAVTGLYTVVNHNAPVVQTNLTPSQPQNQALIQDAFKLKAEIVDADGFTNVRSMKSDKSMVVTTVKVGEQFYTYQQDGNWWQIKTKDGKVGYMHLSRIRLIQ